MNFKLSNYIYFYKDGNTYVVYSMLTGALVEIFEKEDILLWEKMLEFRNEISIDIFKINKKENFLKNLLKVGILISVELDEIEILKKRYYSKKYATTNLNLTIIPTFDCNLNCFYCYQNKKNAYMSEEVKWSIMNNIKKNIKNLKNIHIEWYGGEPLLNIELITSFHEILKDLAEKEKINITSGITTNGILLNKENSDLLKKYNIKDIQITFDGNEEYHNKRRYFQEGNCFQIITNNIKNSIDDFHFYIRINIDKDNIDSIEELLIYFRDLGFSNRDNFFISLGKLEDYKNITEGLLKKVDKFLSKEEFLKKQLDFDYLCKKYNFPIRNLNKPRYSNCIANNMNGFVIDPYGNVYKCWLLIDNLDYSIGNIKNGNFIEKLDKYYNFYLKHDPFSNTKCLKCSYLPICLGGCLYEIKFETQSVCTFNEKCIKNKIENIRILAY